MTQSVTGNAGPKVRSDIEVTLELTGSGGLELSIKSKVRSMYGKAIEAQCRDLLTFFGVRERQALCQRHRSPSFCHSSKSGGSHKSSYRYHHLFPAGNDC